MHLLSSALTSHQWNMFKIGGWSVCVGRLLLVDCWGLWAIHGKSVIRKGCQMFNGMLKM